MRSILCLFLASLTLFYSCSLAANGSSASLSFEKAIQLALQSDPLRKSFTAQRSAHSELATAVQQLPDLKGQLALANVPIDSLSLTDENMTQLKLSLSQQMPRGDSLQIKANEQMILKHSLEHQENLRLLKIKREVGLLWLESFYWKNALFIMRENRELFEHLVTVANAQFRSGSKKLQDVVRSELELARLDDKIDAAVNNYNTSWNSLYRFIPAYLEHYQVGSNLPNIKFKPVENDLALQSLLESHPLIQIENSSFALAENNVELVRQSYKPKWGISAGYGLRQGEFNGSSRSDFLSVGISFDIPIFTNKRQDKRLSAAKYQLEARKSSRIDQLQQLMSEVKTLVKTSEQLAKRYERYEQVLLKQAGENSQSALDAYTSDFGSFNDVIRAYILESDSKLAALRLKIDKLKNLHTLDYYLGQKTNLEDQSSKNFIEGYQNHE